MLKNIKYTLVALSTMLIIACDSPFELDAEQAPTQLVIEGLVTNEMSRHFILVTQTKNYGIPGAAPVVKDAQVEVSDNQGNTYNFIHNDTDDIAADGYYFSENEFAGQVGNAYTMTVSHGGKSYTGSDVLLRVTSVDSLTVKVDEDLRDRDPNDEIPGLDFDEFLEVFFFAQEPQETKDFYLFKYYKNGIILKDFESDMYFAEDTFVGEDIHDIATAGYFAENDTATVEFYSLTRQGYVYYTDLFNVLNNDGGMFGAVPSNPRTNLTGGALGYFQTSAVDRISMIVKDPS